jgi:Na+-translocating ferredoxin:NAD+ oxidoreductase RnfD subunit
MSSMLPATPVPSGGQSAHHYPGWPRAVPAVAAVIIAAHGLVHLMGAAVLWKLGEPGQLRYSEAVPTPGSIAGYLVGCLWLAAAVLFVIAGILLLARRAAWRVIGLIAVVVSVSVIALAPGQAAAGLVVDGLVLIFAATSWLASSRREG